MKNVRFNVLLGSMLLLLTSQVVAQGWYNHRSFAEAVQKGSRTNQGIPGTGYWINTSEYSIDATIEPGTGILEGTEQIVYHNNSPDSLRKLVIRVYQDIFRKGSARDFMIGQSGDIHEGTEISVLKIDGVAYSLDQDQRVSRTSTNIVIELDNPILPGSNSEIEIEWKVQLPRSRQVRMGVYEKGPVFVAYWYPQVAVYDDIDGWDMIDYRGAVEFYNDFNDYSVSIKAPSSFAIWSTGELENPKEVYTPMVLKRLELARQSDTAIAIFREAELIGGKALRKSEPFRTWNFMAREVPDFSFALSDSHLWDACSVEMSDERRVLVSAVYPADAPFYDEVAEYTASCIKLYETHVPGLSYPYPEMLTFCNGNSGGGMETPMMANNGMPESRGSNLLTAAHELSHTYFPFMMGTNERKYAWMDEGWAVFMTALAAGLLDEDGERDYIARYTGIFEEKSGTELDVPPGIPSNNISTWSSLRQAAYNRPGIAYLTLRDMMGDSLFTSAMGDYAAIWAGKHPQPADFFRIIEKHTGDLAWFWEPWFYGFCEADLGLAGVQRTETGWRINVAMTGGMPLAVHLKVQLEDGSVVRIEDTAAIWKGLKKGEQVYYDLKTDKDIVSVHLGSDQVADTRPGNNDYPPALR